MGNLLLLVYVCLRAVLKERRDLSLENLALRQQLVVLKRSQTRLKIKQQDRLFWSWLSRTWSGWRQTLIIVKPATVIGWHRRGFQLYWTKLSQRRVGGRPAVSPGGAEIDSADGDCQSALGSTKNSWRITQAGDRHL